MMRSQNSSPTSPVWLLPSLFAALLCIPLSLLCASTLPAEGSPAGEGGLLNAPPRTWIVDVAANEIRAIRHPDSFLRYRIRTVDAKGDHVRDTIESRDGAVARLILKDGKPLTPEEDKAEQDRLRQMVGSESDFARHIHSDQSGKKIAVDLIQLMPDAMLYTYTPGQPQIAAPNSARQIVIDYAPNPNWSPPSTTAEALTGLSGRMWIDSRTRNLLRMEGDVFRPVNVGWGMLAHVYPGGKVALDQTTLRGNRLIFTRFVEQVAVRALMVKTVRVNSTIEASAFQTLPGPMSYKDAIRLLLETPSPGA
ncbi:MAG: hypothetical protein NVSMB3_15680 [Acidobacteriaceae bacterium]